jgi:hypothetical protein
MKKPGAMAGLVLQSFNAAYATPPKHMYFSSV